MGRSCREGGRGRGNGRRRGGRLVAGHLSAEILQQRVEATLEALRDAREPPLAGMAVQLGDHQGALGRELGAREGHGGALGALGVLHAQAQLAQAAHGLLVVRDHEDQPLDPRRQRREVEVESRVAVRELQRHLAPRTLELVVEDEIPVVAQLALAVEAEDAHVGLRQVVRDLHAQARPCQEIGQLAFLAGLKLCQGKPRGRERGHPLRAAGRRAGTSAQSRR